MFSSPTARATNAKISTPTTLSTQNDAEFIHLKYFHLIFFLKEVQWYL